MAAGLGSGLTSSVEAAIAQLDAINMARESALVTSRGLIRHCANAIRAIHRHSWAEARKLLEDASTIARDLHERLYVHPAIYHAGYTQDALKEYAEAALTLALVQGEALPSAATLGVEPAAYLNGLAEAASELRRFLLDGLRKGETEDSERLLAAMDDIYSQLVTVDYPDAVTGGLRRTTDALRAVLERTRGDLTTSMRQEQLVAALRRVEEQLGNTTSSTRGDGQDDSAAPQ
jgi:translin